MFVIEGVVCRCNAVGLGVWMFVGDHIDGGEGVRSGPQELEVTRPRVRARFNNAWKVARSCSGEGGSAIFPRLSGLARNFGDVFVAC